MVSIICLFSPLPGEDSKCLTHIFQIELVQPPTSSGRCSWGKPRWGFSRFTHGFLLHPFAPAETSKATLLSRESLYNIYCFAADDWDFEVRVKTKTGSCWLDWLGWVGLGLAYWDVSNQKLSLHQMPEDVINVFEHVGSLRFLI